MRITSNSPTRLLMLAALTFTVLSSAPALAHVALDSPNGGEQLQAGSSFTVEWHVVIAHNQLNWDLYYSTTGPSGPWLVIAEDIPLGDGSSGAAHSFQWTVPDEPSDRVRVRVVQDNNGVDYEDISDGAVEIIEGPFFADGFEDGTTGGWSVTVD